MPNKNNLGECCNLLKLKILSINNVVSKDQLNELRNNKYTKVFKEKKRFYQFNRYVHKLMNLTCLSYGR